MENAMTAVKDGLSKKAAAHLYNVPRSTLIRKLSGQVPLHRKMGPQPQLSEKEEIKSMVTAGVGSWKWPSKEDILYYFRSDIVSIIKQPQLKNNRGHYSVPEMLKYE